MNDQKLTTRRVGFAPGGYWVYERGDWKRFSVSVQSYACWACSERRDGYHLHVTYVVYGRQFSSEGALIEFLDSYVEGEQ